MCSSVALMLKFFGHVEVNELCLSLQSQLSKLLSGLLPACDVPNCKKIGIV